MGGFGSGRDGGWGRTTTDRHERVDIRRLARGVPFLPGFDRSTYVGVAPNGAEVQLEWTPQNFGGLRPWFRCPQCERRCAILYRRWWRWACRQCQDLAYESTRESELARAFRNVHRLRRKIGAPRALEVSALANGKPKGMHWATFKRLVGELLEVQDRAHRLLRAHVAAVEEWSERASRRLGILDSTEFDT